MSFISRNNFVTLEDIDLETNLIGVLFNDKYVVYSWVGGCWFRMSYDDLVGEYIDSNHNIKLTYKPEYSDADVDDNTLSMLDYNKEFIIEYIVEQTYINEMKYRKED
jgi:hypothetical protein